MKMSRSGYSDDCDGWELIRWRGAVVSAIRGKRGQQFLMELRAALDTIPEKRLITGNLEDQGEVCALGAVGRVRGLDMAGIDVADREQIAKVFGIPAALAAEIMFLNDEQLGWGETPDGWRPSAERRWAEMRKWVEKQIRSERTS
jgi:hypothetical protein